MQPPFYSRNTAEMYDNILNKPLLLKPNISNAARDLLEGLLQKDRTKRIGAKEDFVSKPLFLSGFGIKGRIYTRITLYSFYFTWSDYAHPELYQNKHTNNKISGIKF